MSSVVVNQGSRYRLYNKGAAEWVLKRSTHVLNGAGGVDALDEHQKSELLDCVTGMAKRGLRCICLTYTDFSANDSSR